MKKVTKKKKVVVKKKTKKVAPKKKVTKKVAKKAVALKVIKPQKPIGKVTHFYSGLKVAIIKFNTPVKTGTAIAIRGVTTNFKDVIKSMQLDHKVITTAPKGKQIGIKVKKKVREGDVVYVG
jgi:hypothetical protein